MQIVLIYILLNLVLFGSLFLIAKTFEIIVWYAIENYNDFFIDPDM